MSTAYADSPGRPNFGGAPSCTRSARSVHLNGAIIACCRAVFPHKTWAALASLFGLSERGAKYKLAGDRAFTVDELAVLLRSEHGLQLLITVMGDANPAWWRRLQQQLAIADARQHERVARRRLREAIHAGESLAATIERAETALCIQDEEFGREQFSAYRTLARVPDRALAAPAQAVAAPKRLKSVRK
jgi:hypothetical protein